TNLVSNDTNGVADVFVHNRLTGVTQRVSVDSDGVQSNRTSDLSNVTDSGAVVVFRSGATNLVPGDTNGVDDIFWHNILSGVTHRVSLTDQSEQSNGGVGQPTVSADGRLIAFDSAADNLVPNDGNDVLDAFVREEDFPGK